LYTATLNGDRVDDITFKALVSTTAGMVRLFLHDGTSSRLLREIPVQAVTASGTVSTWEVRLTDLAILLQNGWSLRVSTNNAEAFVAHVTRGGPF
jgi:hypothetical protein